MLFGSHSGDPKAVNAARVGYVEFLENNAHVIYPILAIAVLSLIAAATISSFRSQGIDSVVKAEVKRELVRTLRREIHGVTAEFLSKEVGVPPFRVLTILEELKKDGIVEQQTDTKRITTWYLKGLTH